MSEREELVKSLRQCAEGTCNGCKYELTQVGCRGQLQKEAADAIEELSRDFDTMNEANIALYNALPRWISVDEASPEEDGNYLVNCGGVVCESNFSIHREAHWLDPVEEWEKYEDVTHWMLLPEPPQEVNDGADETTP